MPRKKRPVFPGDLVHTIFRTYNHAFLFKKPIDHQIFIHALDKQKRRYQNQIFAWTGMSNHHHILQNAPLRWHEETAFGRRQIKLGKPIQVGDMNRDILSYFTRKFNWKNKRQGGLVQDRSKALPVFGDIETLITLVYIHLNPIRAKMVDRLENYPYSNYKQYAYGDKTNLPAHLFEVHPVLNMLSHSEKEQQTLYRQIIEEASRDWAGWRWRIMGGAFQGGPKVDQQEEEAFWQYTREWFKRLGLKIK